MDDICSLQVSTLFSGDCFVFDIMCA